MADEAPRSAPLLVLIEEVRADREALERHAAVAEEALASAPWPPGSSVLAVVAVAIHHFYGAAETIFERVARTFEGAPERSDRWHQELLDRMALDLDDVRPALLRRETARALAPVLGFRHFFRHAYAVAFDPKRLQLAAEDAVRACALLGADLDAFENTLRHAAKE